MKQNTKKDKVNWKNNCILAAVVFGVICLLFVSTIYDIKTGGRAAKALGGLDYSEKTL